MLCDFFVECWPFESNNVVTLEIRFPGFSVFVIVFGCGVDLILYGVAAEDQPEV